MPCCCGKSAVVNARTHEQRHPRCDTGYRRALHAHSWPGCTICTQRRVIVLLLCTTVSSSAQEPSSRDGCHRVVFWIIVIVIWVGFINKLSSRLNCAVVGRIIVFFRYSAFYLQPVFSSTGSLAKCDHVVLVSPRRLSPNSCRPLYLCLSLQPNAMKML